MKRVHVGWMALSLPILATLVQGGSCGPVSADKMDLTVNKSGQGDVVCDPDAAQFDAGAGVTLSATADPGWRFDHWEGDLTGSTNPATLVMDTSKTVIAVFVFASSGCVELEQTHFTTDTTIPAGCYLVNDEVRVSGGALLTLAPGVTLQFAADVGLTVNSDGALNAVGTAASPIVLTAQDPTRGSWRGVELDDSNSASNVLDHVTIEYGGGGGSYYDADLTLWGTSRIAVTNSTLQHSGKYGLWLHESATASAFENNVLTANTAGPASVQASDVGVLTGTSAYSGNDLDRVAVRGGNTAVDQMWSALDADYLIESQLNVDHHTTLAAGCRLIFSNAVGLRVKTTGSLTAQGTATAPIVMTTTQNTRGYWSGVEFDDSNSANNLLSYVTIEYGGDSGHYYGAALTLWGSSQAAIDHCTLRQSANYGFWFHESADVTSFEYNVVTQNAAGAGSVQPRRVGALTPTSSYTGNDTDVVAVRGGNTAVDQTWRALGVAYLIEANTTINHHTTLEPGVTLAFQHDLGLTVSSIGSLTAQGTAAAPIILTAVDPTPGYWRGVELDDSNSSSNLFSYVTIAYGGGGGAYYSADLTLWGSARADVQNCRIEQSQAYGIWVYHSATFTTSGNTYANNTLDNVYLQP